MLVLVPLLSCGDAPTEPPPTEPRPAVPAALSIAPGRATLAALGDTVRLVGEVRDQNGQVMTGATIAWSSSDTSVAGVDGSGLITAVGNGGATITARSGPVSATASVAVEQIVASLTVAPALDSLSVGDKVTLVAKASDANGHVIGGAEVAWASADSAVATVAAGGLVTGVSAGSTMVTATAGDAVAEAVIVVGLRANSITVSPPRLLFAALGDTATLIWKGLLSS